MSNPNRKFFLDVEAIALWLQMTQREVYRIIRKFNIEKRGKMYDLSAIIEAKKIWQMLSKEPDTLSLSDSAVSSQIEEIDEALFHAAVTRTKSDFSDQQREIVEQFIDELLDTRLEIKNAEHHN